MDSAGEFGWCVGVCVGACFCSGGLVALKFISYQFRALPQKKTLGIPTPKTIAAAEDLNLFPEISF